MDWFKVNSKGILRGSLSTSESTTQLIWIKLMCVANETRERDGYLRYAEGKPYRLESIAEMCNVSLSELETAIAEFQTDVREGMPRVVWADDGSLFLSNFKEYQAIPENKKQLDPESARLARAIQARKGAAEFPEEVLGVEAVQRMLDPILKREKKTE